MPKIFVTVGSTQFNSLISLVCSDEVATCLSQNFKSIIIQYGSGTFIPNEKHLRKYFTKHVEVYQYKPSLSADMSNADLIITHGGAGSIFEALRMKKKTVAVINDTLMGNHQEELASELARQKYG